MKRLFSLVSGVAVIWAALCAVAFAQAGGQPIKCGKSVVYDASTSGNTELIPLVSGRTIFICGYSFFSAGTGSVKLIAGTGTACASNTSSLTPAYQLIAQSGIVDPSAFYRGLNAPISQALCINVSGSIAVQAIVYYSQFAP